MLLTVSASLVSEKKVYAYFFRPKHRYDGQGTNTLLIASYSLEGALEILNKQAGEYAHEYYLDLVLTPNSGVALGLIG